MEYNIDRGQLAAHDKTLVPGEVDTVSFDEDPREIEVVTDGTAKLYVTVDGSEPTISGSNTHVLPAVVSVRKIVHAHNPAPVKLISSGAVTYSVARG